jgi:hypothetical protein
MAPGPQMPSWLTLMLVPGKLWSHNFFPIIFLPVHLSFPFPYLLLDWGFILSYIYNIYIYLYMHIYYELNNLYHLPIYTLFYYNWLFDPLYMCFLPDPRSLLRQFNCRSVAGGGPGAFIHSMKLIFVTLLILCAWAPYCIYSIITPLTSYYYYYYYSWIRDEYWWCIRIRIRNANTDQWDTVHYLI